MPVAFVTTTAAMSRTGAATIASHGADDTSEANALANLFEVVDDGLAALRAGLLILVRVVAVTVVVAATGAIRAGDI